MGDSPKYRINRGHARRPETAEPEASPFDFTQFHLRV
jgi:hypothetical protein